MCACGGWRDRIRWMRCADSPDLVRFGHDERCSGMDDGRVLTRVWMVGWLLLGNREQEAQLMKYERRCLKEVGGRKTNSLLFSCEQRAAWVYFTFHLKMLSYSLSGLWGRDKRTSENSTAMNASIHDCEEVKPRMSTHRKGRQHRLSPDTMHLERRRQWIE